LCAGAAFPFTLNVELGGARRFEGERFAVQLTLCFDLHLALGRGLDVDVTASIDARACFCDDQTRCDDESRPQKH
jgi:hypothetical protein